MPRGLELQEVASNSHQAINWRDRVDAGEAGAVGRAEEATQRFERRAVMLSRT
jgi:hypothetical protein